MINSKAERLGLGRAAFVRLYVNKELQAMGRFTKPKPAKPEKESETMSFLKVHWRLTANTCDVVTAYAFQEAVGDLHRRQVHLENPLSLAPSSLVGDLMKHIVPWPAGAQIVHCRHFWDSNFQRAVLEWIDPQ